MPRLATAVAAIGATAAMVVAVVVILSNSPSTPEPVAASAAPTVISHPSAQRPSEAGVLPKAKPISLEVPSIGVHTGELMDLGVNPDNTLQVPPDAKSAGWFTEAPTPGEAGPAVIAGHVDYDHIPGVFTRLHALKTGQEAIVRRADGTTAVFTIYQVDLYPKSGFPTAKVYGDTAGPELRLITCGGSFDHTARQYTDNVVAYGKLTRAFRT
jgi:sortase (surface protein transpeptidase)